MLQAAIVVLLEASSGSHESWWSQHSGDVVLAGAAVIAAGLAAFVSIRNRRKELADGRYLRNQDHIRDTIDAAVVALLDSQNVIGTFMSSIQGHEKWREDSRRTIEGFAVTDKERAAAEERELTRLEKAVGEKLERESNDTLAKLQAISASQVRLRIRLGPDDLIVLKHEKASKATNSLYKALVPGVAQNRTPEGRAADKDLNRARHGAQKDFQGACQAWFYREGPKRRWLARRSRR